MPQFVVSTHFNCSRERAFAVCSDLDRIPERIPEIIRIEKLTDGPFGIGTKFRETRKMFGRESTEQFDVTEFAPPERFTMTAISCGVEFHAEYRFTPEGTGTRVDLTITSKAVSFFAKLMSPLAGLMTGTMKKAILKDLESLSKAAENEAESQEASP